MLTKEETCKNQIVRQEGRRREAIDYFDGLYVKTKKTEVKPECVIGLTWD